MLRLDMHMIAGVLQYVAVASFAEAWIEKRFNWATSAAFNVASFAEAWIEKALRLSTISANSSPPSRRRGLKIQ